MLDRRSNGDWVGVMVLLVEEEVVVEAVVEAMVFGSDTMKVYLRKQSFSNNGERTK